MLLPVIPLLSGLLIPLMTSSLCRSLLTTGVLAKGNPNGIAIALFPWQVFRRGSLRQRASVARRRQPLLLRFPQNYCHPYGAHHSKDSSALILDSPSPPLTGSLPTPYDDDPPRPSLSITTASVHPSRLATYDSNPNRTDALLSVGDSNGNAMVRLYDCLTGIDISRRRPSLDRQPFP
jgi:hypothetical protein